MRYLKDRWPPEEEDKRVGRQAKGDLSMTLKSDREKEDENRNLVQCFDTRPRDLCQSSSKPLRKKKRNFTTWIGCIVLLSHPG